MFVTCPKCSAKYQIPGEVYLPAGKKLKCSSCQHVFVYTPTEPEKRVESAVADDVVENIDPVPPAVEEDDVFAAEPVSEEPESDIPPAFTPVESEPEDFGPTDKRGYGRVIGILVLMALVALLVVLGVLYRDVLLNGMDFPFPKETSSVQSQPTVEIKTPVTMSTEVPIKSDSVVTPKAVSVQTYVVENPQVVALPEIQSVRFEVRALPEPMVRIEGIVKNDTPEALPLPEKVRAVAYDAQGTILFEKDIYLTDRILPAGESRSFFGSYAPAPEKIQWVDVTF